MSVPKQPGLKLVNYTGHKEFGLKSTPRHTHKSMPAYFIENIRYIESIGSIGSIGYIGYIGYIVHTGNTPPVK